MGNLLDLSARIIDSGVADEPVMRINNELSEVADDIAMVESFSNVVLLATDGGVVAFDSSGVRTAAAVVDAIRGWTSAPVNHLVYTHGHADHVGGSAAFAGAWGPPNVIGHENVNRRLDRYAATNNWNLLINARQFGGIPSDFNLSIGDETESFLPAGTLRTDVDFRDRHDLVVDGETVELHHARGETDDHLWAWLPDRRTAIVGDFLIWNFPNAGNPQKVQRYPLEWAEALRVMVAKQPDLLLPAHGLPIAGRSRIAEVLTTIADTLEQLVAEVLAMMNSGATLDEIIHTVHVPAETLAKPYLRPLYDEPEFVVHNVWRQFGGWWDGAASRLKPSPDAELGAVVADLAGGAAALITRANVEAEAGNLRLACHLADFAGWAEPDDPGVHAARAEIYRRRRTAETSLMSKGVFAAAARESEAISDATRHS